MSIGKRVFLLRIHVYRYTHVGRYVRRANKQIFKRHTCDARTSKARAIPCKLHLRVPRARPYRVCSQRAAIFKSSIESGRGSILGTANCGSALFFTSFIGLTKLASFGARIICVPGRAMRLPEFPRNPIRQFPESNSGGRFSTPGRHAVPVPVPARTSFV